MKDPPIQKLFSYAFDLQLPSYMRILGKIHIPGPTEAQKIFGGHRYVDLWGASSYFCIDFQKLWGWPVAPPVPATRYTNKIGHAETCSLNSPFLCPFAQSKFVEQDNFRVMRIPLVQGVLAIVYNFGTKSRKIKPR